MAAQSGIMAGTANVTNATGATISGGVDGINVVGASTVTNAGTITGGTHLVSFNGAGTSTLILQTGSVLIGDALGSSFAGATINTSCRAAAPSKSFHGLQHARFQREWRVGVEQQLRHGRDCGEQRNTGRRQRARQPDQRELRRHVGRSRHHQR